MYRMTPEIVKALQKAKRRTKLSETAYVELAVKEKLERDGIIAPKPPPIDTRKTASNE
jgi:hypothetical protein